MESSMMETNINSLSVIEMLISLDNKIQNLKGCVKIMNHLKRMGKMNPVQSECLENCLASLKEI